MIDLALISLIEGPVLAPAPELSVSMSPNLQQDGNKPYIAVRVHPLPLPNKSNENKLIMVIDVLVVSIRLISSGVFVTLVEVIY